MFRCPQCAKSHKLKLTNGHSLLMPKSMLILYIVKEPIEMTSKFIPVTNTILDVAKALEEHDLRFDFQDGTKLQCFMCKEWSEFDDWVKAWDLPGDYFDADNLCTCGGELWYDNVPGTHYFGLVCEECGFVKPRSAISGGADVNNE